MHTALWAPASGLIALTFVVLTIAAAQRIREIRARRLPLQSLAHAHQIAATLRDTRAMDNFNNLLQMPMLFYVLCLTPAPTQSPSTLLVVGAWLYLALRIAHSAIQIGPNRVAHRFYLWMTSNLVLAMLWVGYGAQWAVLG